MKKIKLLVLCIGMIGFTGCKKEGFRPTTTNDAITTNGTTYTISTTPTTTNGGSTTNGSNCSSTQCSGTTQSGNRCKNMTKNCNGRCYLH